MIDSRNWNADDLAKIRVTPWQMHVPTKPGVVFQDQRVDDQKALPDAPVVPRRIYFKPNDFDQYGYTAGCARCEQARKHGHGQTSKPHTETCRARIMRELATSAEGRERI